jgi:hypothetical protein
MSYELRNLNSEEYEAGIYKKVCNAELTASLH